MQSAEGSRNGNEIMKVELIDIGRVIPMHEIRAAMKRPLSR